MKKLIRYILIILGWNIFLLYLPIFIFILNLSLSQSQLIDVFFWFYLPLIIISLLYTCALCVDFIRDNIFRRSWIGPLVICLAGYAPVWMLYISLSLCWNFSDYLWFIILPLLPGVTAYLIATCFQRVRWFLSGKNDAFQSRAATRLRI